MIIANNLKYWPNQQGRLPAALLSPTPTTISPKPWDVPISQNAYRVHAIWRLPLFVDRARVYIVLESLAPSME